MNAMALPLAAMLLAMLGELWLLDRKSVVRERVS
jgi:hypothetical protein